MRHLRQPVRWTRIGMVAENVVRCFWPFWTILLLAFAPLMMGWQDMLPLEVVWALTASVIIGLAATLIIGWRRFHMPSTIEALARVDATLPGRPIAAISDVQAIGADDPASIAVWQAHVTRMAARSKSARAVEPDLRIADRDPYGLRFIAVLFFVAALLFGSVLRVTSVGDIVAGPSAALASGPVWEGWVEPPAYTGRPTLYLNDIPAGALQVPVGSNVTIRFYGEVGALRLTQSVSDAAAEPVDGQQQVTIDRSGTLAIDGPGNVVWNVTAIADAAPQVALTAPITADALGELSQAFTASDDYGVESGTATIALDLAAVERSYGLAVDPDPIADLVLDLPMPFTGDRAAFEGFLVENLSEHPLANLPVTLQLSVTDAAGQTASTEAEPLILPGRRFFQPVARAVIEQRRDLLWSRDNARRVGQLLRAIAHRPEDIFPSETMYLRVRAIIRQMDAITLVGLDDDTQAEIATALWELAIQLEEGSLADARERLERAQERLAEAMRNGASEAEIAELMQELRDATNDYMRMLAEQAEPGDGTDQADNSGESMELSMNDLQAMMDRIEELMQEGRMAEAQALMEQLNQMMENMRVTQGEGGDGPPSPGQQSMDDLADTLREQQGLSDEAFRDLQDRADGSGQGQQDGQQGQGQDQPGQGQGQGNEPGDQGGSGPGDNQSGLTDRQQALRQELQRQRDGLPNLPGEAGDTTRQSLDRAEGAMEGAEEALRGGDLAEAIDRQAEAMDALRDGMRELGQAMAEAQTGQDGEDGEAAGNAVPGQRDPLGREAGDTGQMGRDQNMLGNTDTNRRAAELLDEIRRRSAEQERPEVERDYLRRLLGQF
ncbi:MULTISPECIES: TIGR02302 family protein [unclassified Yoonia]|uniref:TIGR02302 family protein n=1 Tax=unclassified Yoonia TaxID=2629118 RepID=UPI002AFE6550|nr:MULTISPECIES: TIGR02302 family protein [unclassified Yoonia]